MLGYNSDGVLGTQFLSELTALDFEDDWVSGGSYTVDFNDPGTPFTSFYKPNTNPTITIDTSDSTWVAKGNVRCNRVNLKINNENHIVDLPVEHLLSYVNGNLVFTSDTFYVQVRKDLGSSPRLEIYSDSSYDNLIESRSI
ncbi:hypothetical protein [Nitrosopumilus sp.]|uniref:hypothetical protein n=1 Tax=Nitrosopumilus sp. TaxID=2024843 RepID=UPI003D0EDBFF